MKTCLIVWGNWGPYHYARFRGFREAFESQGVKAVGLELFKISGYYEWENDNKSEDGVTHLNLGTLESSYPLFKLLKIVYPFIKELRPSVVFVPSYWHWSLTINIFARLTGAKVVMMNETHGGTEKAKGIKKWIKKLIVSRFHGALIGGKPHARYFQELGIPEDRIFPGYDAIDNSYFTTKAQNARNQEKDTRQTFSLPHRYFLSLSRMIEKKNLLRLIDSFSALTKNYSNTDIHLIFVGSGDEEPKVRQRVIDRGLTLVDHTINPKQAYDATNSAVHFYGFKQVDENPAFYALCECFLMPSIFEEWGLVANEAMACGRPVIASREAGCAEDLIVEGVTGFTFPSNNTEALTQAMNRFVEDPELSDQLGHNALRHIRRFGCENFGEQAVLCAQRCLAPN